MRDTEQDVRFGYSKTTGNWYRVTEWEDLDAGKMIAKEKEEVDEEEVPERWRGALEWSLRTGTEGGQPHE